MHELRQYCIRFNGQSALKWHMHLTKAFLSIIFVACATLSWAEVTPILNSDAIKKSFGSYGVEVLSQDDTTRIANLFSGDSESKICRTLAVTEFVLPMSPQLTEQHRAIRAGGSIGATLRAAGFSINKKLLIKTETPAGKAFLTLTADTVSLGAPLYTKVYALFAQNGDQEIPYAVIAEAYHPDHFPPTHEEVSDEPHLQASAQRALASLRAALIAEGSIKTPAA